LNLHNKNELTLQVLKKFRIIYGLVRQHFSEIEKTCGVTGSQLWIIQEVSNNPGIGVSLLAEHLSIHQSTCSLLVEKLVNRKLILKERSTEDQRRVGLYLSDEAIQLLKNAPGPAEGLLPEALGALEAEAIKSLNGSLEKLIIQLKNKDDKLANQSLSDL